MTADRTVAEVARELDMSSKTLSRWVVAERRQRAATEQAAAGTIDPAAYQAALRRIAELERENEFLGKVSAFFASKPQR